MPSATLAPIGAVGAPEQILTVAVSARALFDLDESHEVFENEGLDRFRAYQSERVNETLTPGPAFHLVRKLLQLNTPGELDRVDVVLLSRNSPDAGLRVTRSIEAHNLAIRRMVFAQGGNRFRYALAMGVHLFLSRDGTDVGAALRAGVAAATLYPHSSSAPDDDIVRVAFDGDAVIFSDEAERVSHEQGLNAFIESERRLKTVPLRDGPFAVVLRALHRLQASTPDARERLRLGLFTARSLESHERVHCTLRAWGVSLDEAAFLNGRPKGPFLAAFGADVFFDDSVKHVESARQFVAAGHVPHGIANAA